MEVKLSDAIEMQNNKIYRNNFTITMYQCIGQTMEKRKMLCDIIIAEQKRKVDILTELNNIEEKQKTEYTKEREIEANTMIMSIEDNDEYKSKIDEITASINELQETISNCAVKAMEYNSKIPDQGVCTNYTAKIEVPSDGVPITTCAVEVNQMD